MKRKLIICIAVIIGLVTLCSMKAYKVDGLDPVMLSKISDYHIFRGNAIELAPTDSFKLYEPGTGLFTDYAEKQRLIKVPAGYKITAVSDGLPDFPDGTILVKTFYYFNDKRDTSKGKKLIETRLLIKNSAGWSVGTYEWNAEQTEAVLTSGGINKPVNWVDENGRSRDIKYHVPANKECATCHSSNNKITPIGPALKNLPDWKNTSVALDQRVRAYLAVNCAHCHNDKGSCKQSNLRFGYDIPFNDTHIADKKKRIVNFMTSGRMPRIGTTIVDDEAVAMVKSYLKELK